MYASIACKRALSLALLFNCFLINTSALEAESTALNLAFENDIPIWMKEQIDEDLAPFTKSGIKAIDLDELMQSQESAGNRYFLIRFKIHNDQISASYSPTDHRATLDRIFIVTAALKKLAADVQLPDVDFIVTMLDSLDGVHLSVPIFAFANDPACSSNIVLMPDFEALSGNENFLHEVKKGNELFPWASKVNKAIWRGSMTGYPWKEMLSPTLLPPPRMGGIFTLNNFLEFPRTKAISLSLQFPYLIDARYTALTQCEKCNKIRSYYHHYFGPSLSVSQQIRYKYQLLIDGNTSSYSRTYWQLFSNSVILKQTSSAFQWYYRALQPYVHYMPFQSDLSDLVDMVHYATTHDDEAEKISLRAQNFAQNNLSHFRVMQYLYLLLVEYAKLQS